MRIRHAGWFWFAVFLFAPLLYSVWDTVEFSSVARGAVGTVTNVRTSHASCDPGEPGYLCSEDFADVKYVVEGREYVLDAGPTASFSIGPFRQLARRAVGERVGVLYDPRDPQRASQDDLLSVWSIPIFTLFIQIACFVAGIRGGDRREPR